VAPVGRCELEKRLLRRSDQCQDASNPSVRPSNANVSTRGGACSDSNDKSIRRCYTFRGRLMGSSKAIDSKMLHEPCGFTSLRPTAIVHRVCSLTRHDHRRNRRSYGPRRALREIGIIPVGHSKARSRRIGALVQASISRAHNAPPDRSSSCGAQWKRTARRNAKG
jgi:hypothetical protein